MLFAFATAALAAPTPFYRAAPSAVPLEAGHANISLASGLTVIDGKGFGGEVGIGLGITDRLSVYGSGAASGPLDMTEPTAWATVGVRYDLVQTDSFSLAYWGSGRIGQPFIQPYRLDETARLSTGIALHGEKGLWSIDASVNLLSLPFSDEDAAARTASDLLWNTHVVNSWQLEEKGSLRFGFEPLPYVSYRREVANNLYVEPALGVLMAGLKVEGRI